MSGVFTKKFGRITVVGLGRELAEVLLELPLRGAPGEVGVGLLEADRAEGLHHRRPGEGLGQEQDVRVGPADLLEQPLPERHRLGVRVVDAEDAHAVGHPQPDDPQHLLGDAGRVVVEVDRVDVLVLLGRVLGVGDRAVGPGGEPLRVRLHPRVVGSRLEGEVERHLEAELAGPGDERVEVLERAEVGVDRVVAAVLGPDRPGRAGVVGSGGQRVVRALAVHLADRVDRRQVDHVEAHLGHGVEALRGGAEVAADDLAGLGVLGGSLRAREELVPAAEERERAVREGGVGALDGDQLTQRVREQHLGDVGGLELREPRLHRAPGVGGRVGGGAHDLGGVAGRPRGARRGPGRAAAGPR